MALWRLGLETEIGGAMAEPYHLTLIGRYEQAAAWWSRAGAAFDEAMANADSSGTERRIDAIERLELLGATASRSPEVSICGGKVTQLPARPRTSTRANRRDSPIGSSTSPSSSPAA